MEAAVTQGSNFMMKDLLEIIQVTVPHFSPLGEKLITTILRLGGNLSSVYIFDLFVCLHIYVIYLYVICLQIRLCIYLDYLTLIELNFFY